MKISGTVKTITGHDTGFLFETPDMRQSWQVDQSADFPKPNEFVDAEVEVTDESIKFLSWVVAAEAGPGSHNVNDMRLGIYVRIRPGATQSHEDLMQRICDQRVREMQSWLDQENPPWLVKEVRGVVIRSDVGTHPHSFFRRAIFDFLDTGAWGDWVPTDHLTFGGPLFNGAGGHNSGAFSSVYISMGRIKLAVHETIGHGQGAPHNKDWKADGTSNEYSRIDGSDCMGSLERRMNALSRRSMGLLWDDHVLESADSVTAVLVPVESIPSAIPDGANIAVRLLGDNTNNGMGIYLSQRTPLGLYTSGGPAESLHVHELASSGNYTVGVVRMGERLEYKGWQIEPLAYIDGMLHVSARKSGMLLGVGTPHPTQPLPVISTMPVNAVHSGVWEDTRFGKQGLVMFYKPAYVQDDGTPMPESFNGCWFTQTQQREGRGHGRWMTVQGSVVDGVAKVIIRDEIDGRLVDVGRGRIGFDDAFIGEFMFVLDGHRGQMLLSMAAVAGEGSGWWCDSDQVNGRKHEGVLLIRNEFGQAGWLFQPAQWRYLNLDNDLNGGSCLVTRSSFLSTKEAQFSDDIECHIEVTDEGLTLEHDGEVIVMDQRLV